jgi:Matrixin
MVALLAKLQTLELLVLTALATRMESTIFCLLRINLGGQIVSDIDPYWNLEQSKHVSHFFLFPLVVAHEMGHVLGMYCVAKCTVKTLSSFRRVMTVLR